MTQEEKELLLKDLSGRLRYNVKTTPVVLNCEFNIIGGYCDVLEDFYIKEVDGWFNVSMIKPYLRPMSSMTDEEREKFRVVGGVMSYNPQHDSWAISAFAPEAYDWLNSHHFDYRDLISKGLALPATEGMYN